MLTTRDEVFMRRCLELAHEAQELGEVPVGALIVYDEKILCEAGNRRETLRSPSAHAEMLAIEEAAQKLGRWRLTGCTLYVTLEPCTMCAGAIVLARLDRVVFATKDLKAGAAGSIYDVLSDTRLNHQPKLTGGVLENEAQEQLSAFFASRRAQKKSSTRTFEEN